VVHFLSQGGRKRKPTKTLQPGHPAERGEKEREAKTTGKTCGVSSPSFSSQRGKQEEEGRGTVALFRALPHNLGERKKGKKFLQRGGRRRGAAEVFSSLLYTKEGGGGEKRSVIASSSRPTCVEGKKKPSERRGGTTCRCLSPRGKRVKIEKLISSSSTERGGRIVDSEGGKEMRERYSLSFCKKREEGRGSKPARQLAIGLVGKAKEGRGRSHEKETTNVCGVSYWPLPRGEEKGSKKRQSTACSTKKVLSALRGHVEPRKEGGKSRFRKGGERKGDGGTHGGGRCPSLLLRGRERGRRGEPRWHVTIRLVAAVGREGREI